MALKFLKEVKAGVEGRHSNDYEIDVTLKKTDLYLLKNHSIVYRS